jgi:hypothetical protein
MRSTEQDIQKATQNKLLCREATKRKRGERAEDGGRESRRWWERRNTN